MRAIACLTVIFHHFFKRLHDGGQALSINELNYLSKIFSTRVSVFFDPVISYLVAALSWKFIKKQFFNRGHNKAQKIKVKYLKTRYFKAGFQPSVLVEFTKQLTIKSKTPRIRITNEKIISRSYFGSYRNKVHHY